MGSQHPLPFTGLAPQQELPPVFTLRAACPYFSFTTSLMSVVLIELSLFAKSNDLFGLDGLVSSAALRVQELKQLLKCLCVGGVSEERALTLNADQVLAFEFFQVVRQSGIRNL